MSTTEKTTKETSEQTEPEPYKYKCIRIQYPPHPDTELRCRHLAVSYTAFCTDCQQWLDEGISDLLGLFLLGARS